MPPHWRLECGLGPVGWPSRRKDAPVALLPRRKGAPAGLRPGAGRSARWPAAAPAGPGAEWRTYGADLASTRYSPLDQINKDNFKDLEIAWRLNTNPFGPGPTTCIPPRP